MLHSGVTDEVLKFSRMSHEMTLGLYGLKLLISDNISGYVWQHSLLDDVSAE